MTLNLDVPALVLRYESGESVASLARSLSVDASTVSDRLRKAGVMLRGPREATAANLARDPAIRERMGRPRELAVNEAFFDVWTPDSMYVAGFIHADGYINGGSRLVIGLQTRDEPHLKILVKVMGSEHPVFRVRNERAEGCRVEISSARLCRRLESVGVKTNGLLVDETCRVSPDFWRGVVDGDGGPCTAANGRKLLTLCGDLPTIERWLAFCCMHDCGLRSSPTRCKSIWQVNLSGAAAVKMTQVLYGHGGICLDRKRQVLDKWLSEK